MVNNKRDIRTYHSFFLDGYGCEPYSMHEGRYNMSTPATQLKRLEARIPAHIKDAIERAAFLQGRTLTDFIIEVAGSKAREIIREHEIIHLSRADQIAFAEALLKPPEPNAKLKEAADWYRRETGR